MIEVERQRRRRFSQFRVRYKDVADRLGVLAQYPPHTEHIQHPRGGVRNRAHASIERGGQHLRQGKRIGEKYPKAALRECQRKRQADHPASGNYYLRIILRHLRSLEGKWRFEEKKTAPRR